MVVSRIRFHVAHHNWFAVSIDLVIVVVGVFLGTQANNWNQARIDRAQGHGYRLRILADLEVNRFDLLVRQRYYADVKRHAEAALAALDRPPRETGEQFLIDAYQASQIIPIDVRRSTYDEMLSTGRIDSLGDPQLRDRIANYYVGLRTTGVVLASIPPYRDYIRGLMPNAVQRAIRSRCGERFVFMATGTVRAILPDRCALQLSPAIVNNAVAAVREMPVIRAELTRAIADLDVKLSLIAPRLDRTRDLHRAVAAVEQAPF